ncbi:hypothetical protein PM082_006379 [Marasmius tenuissimus]|nr:hypothetical protein PM082_006379 [Marasmius tenuissimus]
MIQFYRDPRNEDERLSLVSIETLNVLALGLSGLQLATTLTPTHVVKLIPQNRWPPKSPLVSVYATDAKSPPFYLSTRCQATSIYEC